MPKKKLGVIQGTLELLVLKTLGGSAEMHGFEILDWIRNNTDGQLEIEEGALYPALHRMQKRGWLDSDWAISERGRRAKYYRLSKRGKQALRSEANRWSEYVEAVEKLSNA